MVKRLLLEPLIAWKESRSRKPLLLDGARQVGKTYLIEIEFGRTQFEKVHKFDFLQNPGLKKIFDDSLEPDEILSALELETGQKIDFKNDLIFLDEVGECQRAVDSLKYFSEKRADLFICASGSNIGLLNSFPVGKTYNLQLFPMNFYEFVLATAEELLVEAFAEKSRNIKAHEKLWNLLLDYYFVGGMPEAISNWRTIESVNDRIAAVRKIHADLLLGYERDFGKYSGKINALHISSVFKSVPLKLQENHDDSVKRFAFKNVIEDKKRYSELRGPIDWLERTNLISKNFVINTKPKSPLNLLSKENFFKLFFFDIGLLTNAMGLSYKEVRQQDFYQKGFIAENFVQNELLSTGMAPIFSWKEGAAEIEFLIKSQNDEIYPLEVKSGKRTKAKSLRAYKDKYNPSKTIKLSANRGNQQTDDIVWPIYYAHFLQLL